MIKSSVSFFLFLSIFLISATLPDISPNDVRSKTYEILAAHARYKKITPPLAKRILQAYIDELDASKTYLLQGEIQKWTQPSEDQTQRVVQAFKKADFSLFQEIHHIMTKAIQRHRSFEKEIDLHSLPKDVKREEFNDLQWAESEKELMERLLRLKALQYATTEKIDPNNFQQLNQLIAKRRLHRETEIIGKNKNQFILATILKALCFALDAHTTYFTPSEANQFVIHIQQRLVGIGAQLRDNLNGFAIVRLIEGGPAAISNKLKINDLIVAVNNVPVVGMDIVDAVELIQGEKGTTVNLTILRENEDEKQKIDIELVRNDIILEETRLETILEPYGNGMIATLRLFSFYQDPQSSCAQDLKNAIEKCKKDYKLKGIILDLRNNAGGLLPQAVAVTGLFINKGIVVSIKDNKGFIQHLRNTENTPLWEGPLVVLVNKASASAAEIVAQTLQDYGRAIVIGDKKTFGKGSFQTFSFDSSKNSKVDRQGEYKVTRGMYYTVSGKSPQLIGVIPDIIVPGLLSELDIGEEFAKFPLENDSIIPHFEDDLEDIPPIHRKKVGLLYNHHLQKQLASYTQYLNILNKNSENRIATNKNYQNFLKEAQKHHFETESVELFEQSDLQLVETYNIIKDLIFLIETNVACF